MPTITGLTTELLLIDLVGDEVLPLDQADGTTCKVTLDTIASFSGGGTGSVTSVNITAPAAGITSSGGPITSSGSITLALANDLGALEALGSTGMAARTGTDTWALRTVTGVTDRTTITNGSGAAGDPTVDISASYVGQSSITTLGTISTGVWNGTAVPVANGGTGLTAGTSGGVLAYTASGTLASSAALTTNALVLGGGAGAVPTVLGSLGTTTTVLHGNAAGAPTFGSVSLSADVTGNLPVGNLNGGTSASSSTFWRGDGTWATPAGGGGGGTAGRHSIPILAGSMRPSVTGGCASLATLASAANQPDIQTLDFDATTQEYAQFSIPMPKSWNEGTVTFVPIWSHAATTTNFGVVWELQAVAVSNDDAIAVAFGTAQTSTDTGGTTNDVYLGPESSAITVSGTPAAEDVVFFRLSRVTGNGSDTMAIDARLHGIVLYITTDAENDA